MSSKHDDSLDLTRPALVLLYGTTNRKHRALDRDVILIGRAHGCDLGLEAPDISSVHCLIFRSAAGFTLRDCQSRAGTKLNGNACRESALHDGDLLQLGPFSFRVHLPNAAAAPQPAPGSSRWQRLERSRRKLIRLALLQRQRLRQQKTLLAKGNGPDGENAKLKKQASALKARVRDSEKRVRALDDAERDLSREREALTQEQAAFRIEIQREEEELAKRLLDAQADLAALRLESEQLRRAAAMDQEVDLGSPRDPLAAERAVLEQQLAELRQRGEELDERERDLKRQHSEFSMKSQQSAEDHQALLARVGQQKSALAQVEETLRLQRLGLDEILGDLQAAGTEAQQVADAEREQLRQENEQLRQALAERSTNKIPDEQFLALKHENEDLKHLLAAMERERERVDAALKEARATGPVGEYSSDVEHLHKQLAAKEAELRELHRHAEEAMGRTDMVFVESQLVEYRRQLEIDRKTLGQEIEQLRGRNQELDEAMRDMELEMSRERAELGRERQRLERLREDVRLELERMQRESGMREKLAPMQSLRDEINSKRQPLNDQTPKPGKEDPAQSRLRGLRNRLSE